MAKKKQKSRQRHEIGEVVYWFPGNMRSPLRRISKKRATQTREYMKLRATFIKARPYCEIFEPCCTRKTTDIHHMNHREGKRLLDQQWWLPACRSCHTFITNHPRYAREMGFTK